MIPYPEHLFTKRMPSKFRQIDRMVASQNSYYKNPKLKIDVLGYRMTVLHPPGQVDKRYGQIVCDHHFHNNDVFKPLKCRPARLDLHESGTIGSQAWIGFKFFCFSFEYLKRFQSSEPLHKKMHLLLLVGITGCISASRNLLFFFPIG